MGLVTPTIAVSGDGVIEMVGNAVKFRVCASTQPGLLKTMGAVRAPNGTVAVSEFWELIVNDAGTSPNFTAEIPLNPEPVIVT